MDIYIKTNKKIKVNKTGSILLKDIAEIWAEKSVKRQLEYIPVFFIKEKVNKCYLLSIIDVINIVKNKFPQYSIVSLGETDTLIEFEVKKSENRLLKYIKIALVSIVLFAGSATAIMSFHSDAQMATVFENYYYIFFNEKIENPAIINLPYSIGLAVGIIVFFNHFSGKKLTSDPTPIEVEMSVYEKDVTDNIIDTLNKENSKWFLS